LLIIRVKEQLPNIYNLKYYLLKIKMLNVLLLAATIVCGSTMPSQPIEDFCGKRASGNYAHPSRCGIYIQCLKGVAYPQQCPSGLWFDAKKKSCSYKTEVQCTLDFCGEDTNNVKDDGLYAHPYQCGEYIQCSKGNAYPQLCPSGLWFDAKIKSCNVKAKAACILDKQDLVEDIIEALFDKEQAKTTAQPDSKTSTALPDKNFQHEITTFVKKLEQTLADGLSDENKKIQILRDFSLSLLRKIGNMKENMKVEFKSMVAGAFEKLEKEIERMKKDIKDVKETMKNESKQ